MAYGLNMNEFPIYHESRFRIFTEGEKHVTRYFSDDVLIIMLDGTLYFNENHQPVQLNKGQYYIQRRGLFQEGVIPSSTARYYYIHFLGTYTPITEPSAKHQNLLPLSGNAYFTESYDGFERLNLLQNINASQVEKLAEFYRILTKLQNDEVISNTQKTVFQLISMITENYQKSYSLDELASISGYSKNHLIRIFKKETGKTPLSYITELRLKEAQTLLTYSNLPIQEISLQCGFGNYINFYKSFVKEFQITPEAWRKNRVVKK